MFKPQLYGKESSNRFPAYATIKRDGFLVIIRDGEVYGRSMKPIANKKMKEFFKDYVDMTTQFPITIQGEFYIDGMKCNEITTYGSTHNKKIPKEAKIWVFDLLEKDDVNIPFIQRINRARDLFCDANGKLQVISTHTVASQEELEEYYQDVLKEGFEGVVVRYASGGYKFGRVSKSDVIGYKMKPLDYGDATVIGFEEEMENLNESFKDELGKSKKRNTKDAKKPTGRLSAFVVLNDDGVKHKVSPKGLNRDMRKEIWDNQKDYLGRWLRYEGMSYGKKVVVRFPQFVEWRDSKD